MAGVYLGGMKTTRALENVFFNNPFFGVLRRNNQMFRDIGCDYCFWTIHFRFVVNSPFRVVYRVVFQEPPELPKCKVKGPSNLNKHRQQQGLPLSLISKCKHHPKIGIYFQKRAVDSNLVCLFKNRWSQCPRFSISIACDMSSFPMHSGRSSRSRRRWSISWRSTRCPTASTATGQAVTAATG